MQYFVWEKIMAKNIGRLVVSVCGMTVIHDIVRVNCGYFVSRKKEKVSGVVTMWAWLITTDLTYSVGVGATTPKFFLWCISLQIIQKLFKYASLYHQFDTTLQIYYNSPESIRAFVMFVISRLLKFISINSNATRASTHWAQCSIQSLLPAITHSLFFLQDGSPFITIL